ncbi:DUF3592 domain-containing protein [Kitasatospora sp. NPDC048365]|uniref:DUF3592 domain-containing protein n=1 Tax=Kitasatospora sp. NPDC048365 TaxID=3364050 RepID=UPI003714EA7F
METPTALAGGVVLTLFGGALLLWCAVELRLRHRLRRHGIPATARVVADVDPYGMRPDEGFGALDSSPLLAYTALDGTVAQGPLPGGTPAGGTVPGGTPAGSAGTGGTKRERPVGGYELRAVEEGSGPSRSVLARPRGHTPLRRPLRLVPGALVQVAYDPRRPSRVVLAAHEDVPTMPADLFWALLGIAALAGGATLLATVAR